MYQIGEFSKITNITIKTLRYYDEQGIFVPSFRGENGYRYYDEGDFKTAQLILLLRNLDFGIAEIKDVLANYDDEDDLSYFLAAKKSMIEQRVNIDKALIKKIEGFIEPNIIIHKPEYKIGIVDIKSQRVASIRFKGAYQDTSKYLGKIFSELKGHALGVPFNCYYDNGYCEIADIEVCVPTNKFVNRDGIETRELPGGKGISTMHKGSYDFFNYAYKAVLDYAKNNHLKHELPTREIYHKGPGQLFMGNPNKYLTEIVVPYSV
ncbi:MAG TPA: MerR family transcriptional regulator [Anaerolineaceae bacterium]|nr:MerR family transcriptional regulator [Anaerolineaceae bacterium]